MPEHFPVCEIRGFHGENCSVGGNEKREGEDATSKRKKGQADNKLELRKGGQGQRIGEGREWKER